MGHYAPCACIIAHIAASFRDITKRFLTEALPAGALFCLGCKGLAAAQEPGYLEDSRMTVQDVFRFSYGHLVPILEFMGKDIGKEKLPKLLETAGADIKNIMKGDSVCIERIVPGV
jgi:hypothetical protein